MKMMYANFFMPQISRTFDWNCFVLLMDIILQKQCSLEPYHDRSKCILFMVHMSPFQAAAGK